MTTGAHQGARSPPGRHPPGPGPGGGHFTADYLVDQSGAVMFLEGVALTLKEGA